MPVLHSIHIRIGISELVKLRHLQVRVFLQAALYPMSPYPTRCCPCRHRSPGHPELRSWRTVIFWRVDNRSKTVRSNFTSPLASRWYIVDAEPEPYEKTEIRCPFISSCGMEQSSEYRLTKTDAVYVDPIRFVKRAAGPPFFSYLHNTANLSI
jgi:hypothetical protein